MVYVGCEVMVSLFKVGLVASSKIADETRVLLGSE
jgi:hypothetical protein